MQRVTRDTKHHLHAAREWLNVCACACMRKLSSRARTCLMCAHAPPSVRASARKMHEFPPDAVCTAVTGCLPAGARAGSCLPSMRWAGCTTCARGLPARQPPSRTGRHPSALWQWTAGPVLPAHAVGGRVSMGRVKLVREGTCSLASRPLPHPALPPQSPVTLYFSDTSPSR